MKVRSQLLNGLGALLAHLAIRGWMRTLDYQFLFYDRDADPASPECRGQKIYILWHEYLLCPVYLRPRCRVSLLVSRHQDAEVLAAVARLNGMRVIRGSSQRGGVAALRQLLGESHGMHLGITPDGPRGPRRHLSAGPIYLASRLGIPLVPLAFGYDRPWRVGSWDRFAIPRPATRVRGVGGPQLLVPADLDRAGIEHFRVKTEQLLNRLTAEAETWAESGQRRHGQQPIYSGPHVDLRRRAAAAPLAAEAAAP